MICAWIEYILTKIEQWVCPVYYLPLKPKEKSELEDEFELV